LDQESKDLILGVEPAFHARVMEALDVVEHLRSGLGQGQSTGKTSTLAPEPAEGSSMAAWSSQRPTALMLLMW